MSLIAEILRVGFEPVVQLRSVLSRQGTWKGYGEHYAACKAHLHWRHWDR